MLFTVKEMEVLCIFHKGSLSATLALLRDVAGGAEAPRARPEDIRSVIEKLSGMEEGEVASVAFDSE